jgi:hypothetical protein
LFSNSKHLNYGAAVAAAQKAEQALSLKSQHAYQDRPHAKPPVLIEETS